MSPIVLILIVGFSLLLAVALTMGWLRREKKISLVPGVSHHPMHNPTYNPRRPGGGTLPVGYANLRTTGGAAPYDTIKAETPDYDTVEADRNLVNRSYLAAPPKKVWKGNTMYESNGHVERHLQNGTYHPAPHAQQAPDGYLVIDSGGADVNADAGSYHVPLETLSHGNAIPNLQYSPGSAPGQVASGRAGSVPVAAEYGALGTQGSRPSSTAYDQLGQPSAPGYASVVPGYTEGAAGAPGTAPSYSDAAQPRLKRKDSFA